MKTAILLLAMLSPVFGRIGETPKECQKRYGGETVADDSGCLERTKDGLRLIVNFRNGKCTAIVYLKSKNDFTDEEITKLLEANYSGKWAKGENFDPSVKTLVSADRLVMFHYIPKKKTIMFVTVEEIEARKKEEAEASKRTMEGL